MSYFRNSGLGRTLALAVLACLAASTAYAGCTNPTGRETDLFYNRDYHVYQFCNGTKWVMAGIGPSQAVTAPNGYFVMSQSTWNGNLGGRDGADAKCLTELTTNTNWMGYATALSNGQLIAWKVRAFICDHRGGGGEECLNLAPSATYYFAYAGDVTKGGAGMTMDGNGLGPNNNANWSDATHFGGSYGYWSDRTFGSDTVWGDNLQSTGADCGDAWVDGTSGANGFAPNTNNTDANRWYLGTFAACNVPQHLVCIVNP